ncbi:SDR family oxidoreductase [Nocardia sp. NPDC019395]|uniref:SDR family oxidoreductase n=1 Tax=Nocardia sp. NPDC019395 TaxID=3154686 RepID=UPI0033EE88C5
MRSLITGVSGFLGIHLMGELLREEGEFVLLTRRDPDALLSTLAEGLHAIGTSEHLIDRLPERCEPLRVDLLEHRFGLAELQFKQLAAGVDAIWHLAALVELGATLDAVRATNVTGTRRVLEFAAAGGVPNLYHVSTAFVAGRRKLRGRVRENELDDSHGFETTYERSKYEGELLVRDFARKSGGRVLVMRPSILVTDRAPHPALPEHLLLRLRRSIDAAVRLRGQARKPVHELTTVRLVGDEHGHLSFLPVDAAASTMVELSRKAPAGLNTYNVVHHCEVPVPVVFDVLRSLSPLPLTMVPDSPADPNVYERSSRRGAAGSFTPYLTHRRIFDDTNTRGVIGDPIDTTVVGLDYLLAGIGLNRDDLAALAPTTGTRKISRRLPQPEPLAYPRPSIPVVPTRQPTFVVTTGRSGSTTLSRVLRAHPSVLSLNEFFASVRTSTTPDAILPAARFWSALAEPHPLFDPLIRGGGRMSELLYPNLVGARYDAHTTGIPAISLMTLPHLSTDPDLMFDELAVEIADWPDRITCDHFQHLFGWLATRLQRPVVVERSGLSLGWIPWLRRSFPEAKFLHLHRDGPDTALSMSQHAPFRAMTLIQDALQAADIVDDNAGGRWVVDPAQMPAEAAELFGDSIDYEHLMGLDIPLDRFGRLWSELVETGLGALADLPDDKHLPVAYQDLITDTDHQLTRIAQFLDVPASPDWLTIGAAEFDPARNRSARHRLPETVYRSLEDACAPATRLLAGQDC